jgi:hypothetical protein
MNWNNEKLGRRCLSPIQKLTKIWANHSVTSHYEYTISLLIMERNKTTLIFLIIDTGRKYGIMLNFL